LSKKVFGSTKFLRNTAMTIAQMKIRFIFCYIHSHTKWSSNVNLCKACLFERFYCALWKRFGYYNNSSQIFLD